MKRISITLLFLSFCLGVFAQQDMLLYNIHGVPQSSYANPSNRFDGRFYIGLPGLSSNYINYTNSVRYNDVIIKDGDSLLLSFDNLISQMKDENYMSFNARFDLMSFGFNIDSRTQITFNVTEVASLTMDYTKDMVRFIYEGNTAFLGSSPDLDGIGINAMHYREYGLGASRQINEKLRVGLRFKYLYGMENIYTERSDISLTTDPETYALLANTDIKIHSSGLDDSDEDEDFMDYFNGRDNRGYGIDLGGFYQLNEKISLTASVVDLGYIRWRNQTVTNSSKGQYLYDGVEVDVFGEDELNGEDDPFDQILDSIESELGFVEEKGNAYTSPLVTKIYLGGNYSFDDQSFAGLVVKSDIFKGQIRPSFSLSYARKVSRWLTVTSNYSVLNGAGDNLGLGAVFDPGTVQFYILTDNVIGAFTPQNTRNLHIRFGINLIFGRNREERKIFNQGSYSTTTIIETNNEEEVEESTEDLGDGEDQTENIEGEEEVEEPELIDLEEEQDANSSQDSKKGAEQEEGEKKEEQKEESQNNNSKEQKEKDSETESKDNNDPPN